jgi:hypothetical protein
MTWMPLVTLIRNLIADGEWHRFDETPLSCLPTICT